MMGAGVGRRSGEDDDVFSRDKAGAVSTGREERRVESGPVGGGVGGLWGLGGSRLEQGGGRKCVGAWVLAGGAGRSHLLAGFCS